MTNNELKDIISSIVVKKTDGIIKDIITKTTNEVETCLYRAVSDMKDELVNAMLDDNVIGNTITITIETKKTGNNL